MIWGYFIIIKILGVDLVRSRRVGMFLSPAIRIRSHSGRGWVVFRFDHFSFNFQKKVILNFMVRRTQRASEIPRFVIMDTRKLSKFESAEIFKNDADLDPFSVTCPTFFNLLLFSCELAQILLKVFLSSFQTSTPAQLLLIPSVLH